ncbi:ion channel regulatory protein UNC-93 domain-containing protein [Ditylenchus destructor]|nr:ion channel regulatory protein UNC-93 domain-containing protein [Ditylenchus destructor]
MFPTEASTLNVIQLGIGFLFMFLAFNSQSSIEETVINHFSSRGLVDNHDGYTSLSICYASFTVCNIVAAPIVEFLGARWSIVLGGLTYSIFQAGFLFLNKAFLYFSSGLLGVGAAVLWTGQGKYLSLNSTEHTAGKNSGLFWALYQTCLIGGGIFLFVVFNASADMSDASIYVIYSVFTGVTVIGAVILACLRVPASHEKSAENRLSHLEVMKSTLYLLTTKRMWLLTISFVYIGITLSFWSGIYPTCVASTQKLGVNTRVLLALNTICVGLGQVTSSLLFGLLGAKTRRLGRDGIIILGAIVHLLAYVAIFINFPAGSPLGKTNDAGLIEPSVSIALLCGFLLGFGDACWNTQINAFLAVEYSEESAQAFSVFKFFVHLGTSVAFYYSKVVELQWHLFILTILGVAASASFFILERMAKRNQN